MRFRYLLTFAKTQLIVTAASLPILVGWGLPISLMAVVGNFIFTPVLTIFLSISTIIFFTEIFSIPNQIFISALSSLIALWEKVLALGSKSFYIGIAKPENPLNILLIVVPLFFLLRFLFNIFSKMMALSILIIATYAFVYQINYYQWPTSDVLITDIKKLDIIQKPNHTIELIDHGAFNRKWSPEKFAAFTIRPYLIKKFGLVPISKVTFLKPNDRATKGIEELEKTFS